MTLLYTLYIDKYFNRYQIVFCSDFKKEGYQKDILGEPGFGVL